MEVVNNPYVEPVKGREDTENRRIDNPPLLVFTDGEFSTTLNILYYRYFVNSVTDHISSESHLIE